MGKLRSARRFLCLVLLIAPASGCQVMHQYRPMPVLVRDAETKKPISDADVHLSYPLSRDSLAPFDSSQHTESDGVARLRAAPYGDFGIRVEATAAGYMAGQVNVSSEDVEQLKPTGFLEKTEQRPPEFVVAMYSEPSFTVELVVPSGYHGRIEAQMEMQDNVTPPVGQRCFRYEVVDGFVRIKGPGIVLRRVNPSDYRAVWADGTPLTDEISLAKVGFRWLRGQDKKQYFVVGTQPEFDMQRRYADDADPSSQSRAATKNLLRKSSADAW